MKIVVFYEDETYFAQVVESNGDEHELTRAKSRDELLQQIKSMGVDAPIEYHEDVPQ